MGEKMIMVRVTATTWERPSLLVINFSCMSREWGEVHPLRHSLWVDPGVRNEFRPGLPVGEHWVYYDLRENDHSDKFAEIMTSLSEFVGAEDLQRFPLGKPVVRVERKRIPWGGWNGRDSEELCDYGGEAVYENVFHDEAVAEDVNQAVQVLNGLIFTVPEVREAYGYNTTKKITPNLGNVQEVAFPWDDLAKEIAEGLRKSRIY